MREEMLQRLLELSPEFVEDFQPERFSSLPKQKQKRARCGATSEVFGICGIGPAAATAGIFLALSGCKQRGCVMKYLKVIVPAVSLLIATNAYAGTNVMSALDVALGGADLKGPTITVQDCNIMGASLKDREWFRWLHLCQSAEYGSD